MRIAVIGAGGVGGYFGARLAAAGSEVTFVARGRHLAAMRERGLKVESALGVLHLARPRVVETPAQAGVVDAVLFTVKLWDAQGAAGALAPLLGPDTVVVPFQNGVEVPGMLRAALDAKHVAGGVAYIAATIREPGVIAHTGQMARLLFGELDGRPSPRLEALLAACKAAGIDATLVPDIRVRIWEKFVFLAAFSGLTALARSPASVVRTDPDLRRTFAAVMRENAALAAAEGVALPEGFVEERMRFLDGLPETMRSSMQNDLEAGNPLEAPWLAGAVVRMSEARGLRAPVNATIWAAMKPYVEGRKGTAGASAAPSGPAPSGAVAGGAASAAATSYRPATERPFRVLGIQQVALGALDKSKLRRLWVDTFGLELTGNFRSERENVDEDIAAMGSGPSRVEVDLMQPLDASKKPAVHEPPLNHIGLWIDDLPAAVAWLAKRGVRFAPGGIRRGASGHDICFVHPKGSDDSPIGGEGVLIELVQAPPEVVAALTRG